MTTAFSGTVKPARPAYPPPVPTNVPSVAQPDNISYADNLIRAVGDQYQQWRDQHTPDIPPEILAANAGAFRDSESARSIPAAVALVANDAAEAQQNVSKLLKQQSVPATADAQTTAQRDLDRIKSQISGLSGGALLDKLQQIIADCPDRTLPVIVEDVLPLVQSKGVDASALHPALAQRIPALADAHQDATWKAKAHSIIANNAAQLTRSIEKDTNPPAPVPLSLADGDTPRSVYRAGA